MDCLIGPVIDKVIDCTCGMAAHRLAKYSKTIVDLEVKLAEWRRAIGTLQGRVNQEKQDGRLINEEVQKFLNEAAVMSEKVMSFLQVDSQRADVKCFIGSVPNLCLRRQLRKRAKEMIGELSHAVEALAGERFHTITSRPILPGCIADRGGFEDFGTRELILKEAMVYLSSEEVTKVGLYGMGGVGKTMLAQEVARRATEEKLFSEVVFTTVSQVQDLKAIQQSVADKIRLDFRGVQSVVERADLLKCRLKEEKKILIILDDLWDTVELGELGLNFDRDQQPRCKILMTSRSRFVTYNSMDCEKNISVKSLGSIEARKLFATIVGDTVFEQPETTTTANNVVDECKGLPLAIKTVGSALKGKQIPDWEDALLQLRNSAPENIEGMLTQVFPSIRLSYDYLKIEEAKRLLLLCSLYAEDKHIEIEELTMLCVGLGLFSDIYSVAAARTRVQSLVGKLKDRCLLLDGHNDKYVKLHDVIRDVAIYIASGDKLDMHSFVIDDILEDRLSNKKGIKDAKAISLHRHLDYNKFPEISLNCPQLELFLISLHQSRYYSDDSCFQIKGLLRECINLKALSLLNVDLVSLPSPIHSLQNLVTLRLHHCELDDIDFIGDLKSLIVVDLSSSSIRLLPSRIGQLNRLKVLNLRGCKRLEVIKENVISRLTELEELHIPHSYENWGVGEAGSERRNANVSEVMKLQKLTSLFLRIPDAETLPKEFVFSQQLERYGLNIGGGESDESIFEESSRMLRARGRGLRVFGSLTKRSEYLCLEGSISGLKNNAVYDTDHGQDFPHLKCLCLDGCDDIKYIINVADPVAVSLNTLYLEHLDNLEAIWRGNPTGDSFAQLRSVDVIRCGRLKNLFPLSIAKRLDSIMDDDDASQLPIQFQLCWLKLQNLPKFVGLFGGLLSTEEAIFTKRVAFPQLNRLFIDACDNLKYFSSISTELTNLYQLEVKKCRSLEVLFVVHDKPGGDKEESSSWQALSFPELRVLELVDLPNFKKFDEEIMQFGKQDTLFNKTAFPKLNVLTLSGLNNESLFPDFVINMQKLETFEVSNCNMLKYLFSFTMAKSLVNLMTLRVSECNEMEAIVARKESDRHDWAPNIFPRLYELRLHNLPTLERLCLGSDERVLLNNPTKHVVDCPKLKTFF